MKLTGPDTKKQLAQRMRFTFALAYAKSVLADPEKAAAYAARLKPGQTVYHLAVSDFLKSDH